MSFIQTLTKATSRRLLQAKALQNVHPSKTSARTTPLRDQRSIWGYVAVAFNRVDADRLSKVGPNRLCAEWILKNGGGVRFTDSPSKLRKDYNALPPESTKFYIKVVDASNASIMKIGFQHFDGCDYIDTVILHNCKHLEWDSLSHLQNLSKSLLRLQVSGCYNICDEGLLTLCSLKNLQQLLIFDMVYVKDMKSVQAKLQEKLPNCKIEATTFGMNTN